MASHEKGWHPNGKGWHPNEKDGIPLGEGGGAKCKKCSKTAVFDGLLIFFHPYYVFLRLGMVNTVPKPPLKNDSYPHHYATHKTQNNGDTHRINGTGYHRTGHFMY
jgi:hypothetical protein